MGVIAANQGMTTDDDDEDRSKADLTVTTAESTRDLSGHLCGD